MLRSVFVALIPFLAVVVGPSAAGLPSPTGPAVLTVSGQIGITNGDGVAVFDETMLDGLSQHTTNSETPWYDSPQSFSGPLISSLLDAVGAEGTMVTVTALNDYSADIPIGDFKNDAVIFASRINGELLSVRDKGPLFVIYPFDANPDLYNEVYFGRSVWQVTSMTVH